MFLLYDAVGLPISKPMAHQSRLKRARILVFLISLAAMAGAGYFYMSTDVSTAKNTNEDAAVDSVFNSPSDPFSHDTSGDTRNANKGEINQASIESKDESTEPTEDVNQADVSSPQLVAKEPSSSRLSTVQENASDNFQTKTLPPTAPPSHEPPSHSEIQMSEPVASEPFADESSARASSAVDRSYAGLQLSAFYGFKYLSLEQSKTLGQAEISVLAPSYHGLSLRYVQNEWSGWFRFQTYRVKYESSKSSETRQYHSFLFAGSWRFLWAGLRFEQVPLFKNQINSVTMAKQTFNYATLGAEHEIALKAKQPTYVNFQAGISFPLGVSTDLGYVEVSDPSGFDLEATTELRRQLNSGKENKLYFLWSLTGNHQSLSQNTNWPPSVGRVETHANSIATALGIRLDF